MPKISELPAVGSVNTTDTLPLVQGGATSKATFSQLPVSTPVQTALDLKANIASPSFTGNATFGGNIIYGSSVSYTVNGTVRFSIDSSGNVVLNSTGALTVPVGTTAERPSASTGMIRFNDTIDQFEGYDGSSWGTIGAGAKGATGNQVFFENDQTVTGSYTLTTGKNAMSAGPITINSGVTVTVGSGQYWTVVGG
jgi:hypothetical protein